MIKMLFFFKLCESASSIFSLQLIVNVLLQESETIFD